jgi:hypothetical protein
MLARLLGFSSKGLPEYWRWIQECKTTPRLVENSRSSLFFISRACASAIVMEVICLLVTEYARHACVLAVMS